MKTKHLGMLSLVIVLVLTTAVFAASAIFAQDNLAHADIKVFTKDNANKQTKADLVQNEIIVKFKGDKEPFRIIKIQKGKVKEKIKEYSKKANVIYAEPNYIAYAQFIPNDPYYSYQWHLDNSVYGGIQMEEAWNISTGNPLVIVAIVDTGIAYENYGKYCQASDLAQTSFVPGYDFVNNDNHPNDDNNHGTHVAGTVAQSTNNARGVAGVAFKTSLMPVKVLDKRGSGTYASVASGIRFAADNGAKVISLSLGGSSDSITLKEAVAYAYQKGVTVVAACGNENKDSCLYPAAYDDYAIAVGATQYDETKAPYSNYGSSLDLVAPGGNNNLDQNNDGYADGVLQQTFQNSAFVCNFAYYFFQGTSMATPHVSGVAALLIAKGNAITPDKIRAALQETAKDLGTVGRDNTYGYGLVNAAAALSWTPPPVDNPPIISITNPLNGDRVSGLVIINATASDDIGVVQVDFYVNNVLLGSDFSAPYEFVWNSTSVTDGTYTLTAIVIDTISQTSSNSINVLVDNVNDPPVANAGPDQSAYVNRTVYFNGSASYDDGTIISYSWDFGDGTNATGETTNHVYIAPGNYTVSLVVTDNGGLTGSDTAIVTISEALPSQTIHVGNITFIAERRTQKTTPYCRVTSTIPVLNSSDIGVGEATVYGSWSGAYTKDVSGLTNGEGKVSFKTDWVERCGVFNFCVTNITKTDWIYDSSANIETCDSITL